MLDKYDSKGIFFVLGRVAKKHPEVIKKIAQRGHQIGTHGYAHQLIYEQTREEFDADLKASLKVLEDITGEKITAYRAPSYSITNKSIWALEVLVMNGITVDSSIVPTSNYRFGIKGSSKEPYFIEFPELGKRLLEIPPNVSKILTKDIPISSGFAFRLFPKLMINNFFKTAMSSDIQPMIILHNWEVDPEHPRLDAGFKGNTIHYHNIGKTKDKLEYFAGKYKFSGIKEDMKVTRKLDYQSLVKTANQN